jgi:hypothetical protein
LYNQPIALAIDPANASYLEVESVWTNDLTVVEALGNRLLAAHPVQPPALATWSSDTNCNANIVVRPAAAQDCAIRNCHLHPVIVEA